MEESNYALRPDGLLVFQDPVTHMDYAFMQVNMQEGVVLARNLNAAYQRVLRKDEK